MLIVTSMSERQKVELEDHAIKKSIHCLPKVAKEQLRKSAEAAKKARGKECKTSTPSSCEESCPGYTSMKSNGWLMTAALVSELMARP